MMGEHLTPADFEAAAAIAVCMYLFMLVDA